jgi:hypothetical protein
MHSRRRLGRVGRPLNLDVRPHVTSREFQRDLGAAVVDVLGGAYRFLKSRLELRAAAPGGHNVVVLAGYTKYSPRISVDFYFGRNFAAAKRIGKRLAVSQFYYHIQQFSPNREHMSGLEYTGPYTWSVDICNPPSSLVAELAAAVRGIAVPFFERFVDIGAARDAIAASDPWCFGGKPCWRQLLLLDMAMNDLGHFEHWRGVLDDLSQTQASEMISAFKRYASECGLTFVGADRET